MSLGRGPALGALRLSRRRLLQGVAAGAAGAVLPDAGRAEAGPGSLAALAARKGLFFGSAVTSAQVSAADAYRRLLVEECGVWTPEWEMKWDAVERERSRRDFAAADTIVETGRALGKRIRGHALLWHAQLPEWFAGAGAARGWESDVEPYLTETLRHFGGRLFHLDVVNEPIEPDHGAELGLRRTPFLALLGRAYLDRAFRLARELAPGARLYLNEYGLCQDAGWQERRRHATLRLLEALRAAGTPVDGLGIQSHIEAAYPIDGARLRRFLRDVADLGLEISITELDVREARAPDRSPERRDQTAADLVRQVLSVALDEPAVRGVVTWGLSDRVSWIQEEPGRAGNRGLPYDRDLKPTRMRGTLADLFRAAPARPADTGEPAP